MDVRQVVPRDAIPSVDDPTYEATYDGDSDDEVIVVEGAPTRAYPVRYLHYHEIVNSEVERDDERVPIAVTWCPLCGSAVVYDRRVETDDGVRELTFGVSGKLADDDLVMYDRETESEWKQSLGTAIAGPLAGTDLDVLPAALVSFERFAAEYALDDGADVGDGRPRGEVLAPPGGASEAASDGDDPAPIDYDTGPYERYFEVDGFGLAAHRETGSGREWGREDLAPKAVVLGLERDGEALGFSEGRVETAGGVVQATVGDESVVVFASEGLHAFADPGYAFTVDDDGRVTADGTTWNPTTGGRRGRAATGPTPGPTAVRVHLAGRPRCGRVLVGMNGVRGRRTDPASPRATDRGRVPRSEGVDVVVATDRADGSLGGLRLEHLSTRRALIARRRLASSHDATE
nr:DUF3179 domain-containing (seleno)protein [Halomarina oriensis]